MNFFFIIIILLLFFVRFFFIFKLILNIFLLALLCSAMCRLLICHTHKCVGFICFVLVWIKKFNHQQLKICSICTKFNFIHCHFMCVDVWGGEAMVPVFRTKVDTSYLTSIWESRKMNVKSSTASCFLARESEKEARSHWLRLQHFDYKYSI